MIRNTLSDAQCLGSPSTHWLDLLEVEVTAMPLQALLAPKPETWTQQAPPSVGASASEQRPTASSC
jgi:hypothetical protein